MNKTIKFSLDFNEIEISSNPLKRLLDVLREDFNITGVKEGCSQGECGACAVLIDGLLVNSCMYPIGKVDGKHVITIEGLRRTNKYKILEESFIEAGAVQCGFCTPGLMIATTALLNENPNPTEKQIREGISGNLCRCTGYNMIIDAIKIASKRGEGVW